MAVQLPDFTSVGVVNPQPTGQLPSFPGVSAQAAGEHALGQGLQEAGHAAETVAAYGEMARTKMDRAMADASLTGDVIRLGEQLKTETDPAKITALGQQYQAALDTAGQHIGNPAARQLWAAERLHVVTQGQADADLRNTAIYRQNYGAGVLQQLDEQSRLGATASDPAAFPAALKQIDQLTQSGVESGTFEPEAAYRLGRAATAGLVAGRAKSLINSGNAGGAISLLDQYPNAISPVEEEALRGTAKRAQQKQAVGAAIDNLWGGHDKGFAGNLNAGSAPAISTNAVNTEIPPEGRAFLDTIAGPESSGAYNVRWNGPQGDATFNSYADHPRIYAPGPQGPSSAAGRYQIVASTWDPLAQKMGLPDFSPKNQDAAAWQLAQDAYKQETGGDLLGALKSGNLGSVQAAMKNSGQWTTANMASYGANLAKYQSGATSSSDEVLGNAQAEPLAGQPAQPQGPAPLPDLNGMIAKVQDRVASGDIDQDSANAIEAGLRARYNHLQASQTNDRAAFLVKANNAIAALQDGKDVDYDPALARHFFPPEQAAELNQKIDDARQAGQIISGVNLASPDEVAQQHQQMTAALSDPNAPDYAKRRRQLELFDQAITQRNKLLNDPKTGDPANYLLSQSPTVSDAFSKLDPKDPSTYQNYATATLSEQARLGVDPSQQHVLARIGADKMAASLIADPEHAPDTLKALQTTWGAAWPQAWHDLVTLGKLPASYEAVATLDSPRDASLLARALSEVQKNPGKTWSDLVGSDLYSANKKLVRSDPTVLEFKRSLEAQPGMSAAKTEEVLSAIDTLASARAVYMNDPSAAQNAINAFTSQYSFSMPGGPRVPVKQADAVSANAATLLNGLTPQNISIPSLLTTGSPALPNADDYVNLVKSSPQWVNAPTGNALWLTDNQGRIVRNANNQPLSVRFDAPPPANPPPAEMSPADLMRLGTQQ